MPAAAILVHNFRMLQSQKVVLFRLFCLGLDDPAPHAAAVAAAVARLQEMGYPAARVQRVNVALLLLSAVSVAAVAPSQQLVL